MDDAWIELPLMTDEHLAMPPTLHAVPATSQPQLLAFEWVTYGEPGAYWLVDEAQVYSGPRLDEDGREVYFVIPPSEYGASLARGELTPDGRPSSMTYPVLTEDLWVYRPEPGSRTIDDLRPAGVADWMERTMPDLLTPPAVRRPRPAREMPSLASRRLVVLGIDDSWVPVIACSEPYEHEGRISVQVMQPPYYYPHAFRAHNRRMDAVRTVGLHRLWAY